MAVWATITVARVSVHNFMLLQLATQDPQDDATAFCAAG